MKQAEQLPDETLVADMALALQIDKDYAYVIIAEALAGRPALLNLHGFTDVDHLRYKVGGSTEAFKNSFVGQFQEAGDAFNKVMIELKLLKPVVFITNLLQRVFG